MQRMWHKPGKQAFIHVELVSQARAHQIMFDPQEMSTAHPIRLSLQPSQRSHSPHIHPLPWPMTRMINPPESKSTFPPSTQHLQLLPLSQIALLYMFIILDLRNISTSLILTIVLLVSKHSLILRHLPHQPIPTNEHPQRQFPKRPFTPHPFNHLFSLANNPLNNKSPLHSLLPFPSITLHPQHSHPSAQTTPIPQLKTLTSNRASKAMEWYTTMILHFITSNPTRVHPSNQPPNQLN